MEKMNILSVENLEKTVKDEPLFSSLTFGLEKGEKVGIVGKNGAGKSTLLKVLAGILYPDEGTISIKNGTDISYLEQNVSFCDDDTVEDFFFSSISEKTKKLKRYYDSLKQSNEKEQMRLFEEVEKEGLFSIERRYYALLSELGVPCSKDDKVFQLSGGEQKKMALARAFATGSEIILLDEPTNHLDIRTIEKMEEMLRDEKTSAISVTHDRHILDSVCTTIFELDRSSFYRHPGSYSSYLERKAERLTMAQKQKERMESVLKRELKWLQRAPKARTGKDKGRIERAEKLKEAQNTPVYEKRIREFSSEKRRLGKKILEVDSISKSYDGKKIFSPFSFIFEKNMKIALVGENGSGKSTFLDVITGNTAPDSGRVEIGVNTVFGYYDQKSRLLNENKSVIEYISDIGENIELSEDEKVSAARFLELFGFPQSMHRSPISILSGGEKRRLYLISRLVENPNFLILDEPTNDLDIDTMESLEDYISSFPGPVLICSHDRTFLDITTETTLHIKDGIIQYFAVPVSTFLEEEKEREKEEKRDAESNKVVEQRTRKEEKKRLSFKEQREYELLQKEIEGLEKEVAELEESFSTMDSRDYEKLLKAQSDYEEKNNLLNEKIERFLELDERA